MMFTSRSRARRGAAQLAVVALLAVSVVAISSQSASAAGNTNLNSESFNSATTTSGEWSLPTAAGGTTIDNTACLTASSDVTANPIPGCSTTAIDVPGSGVLRLSSNSNNQVGTVYSSTSVPTSKGLDINFTSYQWNDNHAVSGKIGADGISFVLAATDPANPTQPSALGPAGGALGYAQESTTKQGVSYGYLGIGLDNYGNYTNTKYGNACPVSSETTGLTNNGSSSYAAPNASRNSVTVRGPGNGTTGYCEMTTTSNPNPFNSSPYSTTSLVGNGSLDAGDATTRPSGVPVEIALNTSNGTVATGSGLSVPAKSWLVSVTPEGGTAQQMTGLLPSTSELSTLGFPSSWLNPTTGLPYQLAFGWAASTGGAVEYHEISNQSITTLNGALPDYDLAISDSQSGSVTVGSSFVASITPSISATGGDESEATTVVTTFPAELTPPASPFSTTNGYNCTPNGQVVICQYAPPSTMAAGSTYPALLIPVTTTSSTAVGNYTFTSKASSVDGNPAIATHSVAVVNDLVTAVNDTAATTINSAVATDVLTNDTTSDATKTLIASVSSAQQPAHGTASVGSDNKTVSYTPATGLSGVDSYRYTACDNSATPVCSTATVTVTVTNVVHAVNDTVAVAVNSSAAKDVTANDTTADSSRSLTVTISSAQQPAHGTVVVGADDKTVTYTPAAGYSGPDSYNYTVCDNSAIPVCDSAAVAVTVSNAVQATADTATVATGSTVATDVTANDTSGDPTKTLSVTVSSAQQPSHGSASVGSDSKTVIYTPTAGYSGLDSYSYTVCDNSATPVCDSASVSVTITNVVAAVNDSVTVAAGSSFATNVTANDTSADASKILSVAISTAQQPAHGTAVVGSEGKTVTYTPAIGYSGPDGYSYTVCDNSATPVCDSATVAVTVTNVIHAVNDTETTSTGSSVAKDVTANDTSADASRALSVTISTAQNPTHGTVSIGSDGKTVTYTPTAGYSGSDSYGYSVCDNSATPVCDSASVSVTVTNVVHATPDDLSVATNSSVAKDVTANDTSADPSKTLSVTISTAQYPSHGTVSVGSDGKTVTYTPTTGYSGSDSFSYTVCDSSTTPICDTAGVSVNAGNVVHAVDDTATVTTGSSVARNVTSNDTSADSSKTLSVTISNAQKPAHGTVAIGADNETVTYTPAAGYSGTDSFSYTVCDNSVTPACDAATVNITVDNVVHATADAATVAAGSSVATNVAINDTTADISKSLSVTISNAQKPAHGTVSVGADGKTVTYTPVNGYSGPDAYSYTICDSSATPVCDTAAVNVTVTNVVSAAADSITVSSGSSVAKNVLSNDTTADGSKTLTATISNAQNPSHGSATVGSDGKTVTYVPTNGYSGPDSFSYTVCDSSSTPVCDTAAVSVAVNDVVTVTPDTATVSAGGTVTKNVLTNDATADPSKTLSASISSAQQPSHGMAAVTATGDASYTPTPGFSGTDAFQYTACDSSPTPVCATGTVTVVVTNSITASPSGSATPGNTAITAQLSDVVDTTGEPLDPSATTIVTQPGHGTLTKNNDGSLTYTPTDGYAGPDSYRINVCDTSSPAQCASVTVPVNVGPNVVTATPDTITASTRGVTVIRVLSNDSTQTGQPLDPNSIQIATPPLHGTATVVDAANATATAPVGSILYSPNSGYSGTDSLRYRVCDTSTPTPVCAFALVTLAVPADPVVADVAGSLPFTGSAGATTLGAVGLLLILTGLILMFAWRRRRLI